MKVAIVNLPAAWPRLYQLFVRGNTPDASSPTGGPAFGIRSSRVFAMLRRDITAGGNGNSFRGRRELRREISRFRRMFFSQAIGG